MKTVSDSKSLLGKKTLTLLALLCVGAILLFNVESVALSRYADEPESNELSAVSSIPLEDSDAEEHKFYTDFVEKRKQYTAPVDCPDNLTWSDDLPHKQKLLAANCGSGFKYKVDPNADREWVVAFYGRWSPTYYLTGCPNPKKHGWSCPYNPKCKMIMTNDMNIVNKADVVVATSSTASSKNMSRVFLPRTPTWRTDGSHKQYRVLYLREPSWRTTFQRQKWFDFEMGVHTNSGVVNPLFLRRPRTLVNDDTFHFLPFEERDQFALSIISNCNANDKRQTYIDHLVSYLGKDRVHQYGSCGDGHKLPPKPINNAAKVIAKYKFFFAFENSVMPGYVTEKLFVTLNMGVIPVYMGAPDLYNITKTRSYINVADYSSPKHLAEYLVYLSRNETAYNEYHVWREDESLFHDEFLKLVSYQMPSANELSGYQQSDRPIRSAACCRLCNEQAVSWALDNRPLSKFPANPRWDLGKIARHFYGGKMKPIPDPAKSRID